MRRWWRGVHAALRDDEVLTRGTWRILVTAVIVAGSVCMAIVGFVGDPPETVPASLLLLFAALLGTLMADHVAIDDGEVVNFRAMPIGTSRTARASINAVGWSKQPMGFVAPVLVLRDDTHVVLTALGRQTLWGPSSQAEMLADRLGVATAGQLPPVGFSRRRASSNRRVRVLPIGRSGVPSEDVLGVARPDIEEIESLLAETTPGPWYVRGFDDDTAATLIAVATEPDDGAERRWPDFPARDIVAVTLLQSGVPFGHRSKKSERNAQLIAKTPEYLSQLVAEVKRLRRLVIETNGTAAGSDDV